MKILLALLCCGLLLACEPHGRIKQMKSPVVVVAVDIEGEAYPVVLKDSTGRLFSFAGETNIAIAISNAYKNNKIAIGDTLK